MIITNVTRDHYLDLLPIFLELETFYFKENAASEKALSVYLKDKVFSTWSGVKVIAAYERKEVVGFATFTVMYPAPNLAGQLYMKDLFVSSRARGKGVGIKLMQYLAKLALKQECNRFDWTAESTNPNAGDFYQSIGATLIEEKQYYRFEGKQLRLFAQHIRK